MTLSLLEKLDPAKQHFESDPHSTGFIRAKGGVDEDAKLTFTYNQACCSPYPQKEKLEERTNQLHKLILSYCAEANDVPYQIKGEEKDKLLKQFVNNTNIVSEQLNTSYVGYSVSDILKPDYIQRANQNISNWSRHVKTVFAKAEKLTKEALEIRGNLKLFGVAEDEIQKIVEGYCKRACNRIAGIQWGQIVNPVNTKDRHGLSGYLCELVKKVQDHVTYDKWDPRLKPPTDPETLHLVKHFWILYHQLENSFPELWQERNQNIPKISPEDTLQCCDDLMTVSVKILDAAISDLKKWQREGQLDNTAMAKLLLVQERRVEPYSSGASYVARVCFLLPIAYHLIAKLNDVRENQSSQNPNLATFPKTWRKDFFVNDTLQGKWRTTYNDKCKEVFDLVGAAEIDREDHRFTVWAHQDTQEDIARKPDTLPTGFY